jgi:glycerophosphoryl diester phosphodiesterase
MSDPLFPRPIAHRGLHDRARGVIENSASAFEAAIAGKFAIECDVQLTSDGVPMVFHDDELERLVGGPGFVADVTAAELAAMPLLESAAGDRPQRLTEFLEQVAGRALLQIELKHQRSTAGTEMLARRAAEALRSYTGPVTVESFDPKLIIAVRGFGFTGPRGIITYAWDDGYGGYTEEQQYVVRHLLHWHETRFDFISCDKEALDLPAIKFWRALGKPVTAWTVRSSVEAEAVRPLTDQIVFEGYDPDLG